MTTRVIEFQQFTRVTIFLWSLCGVHIYSTKHGSEKFPRARKIAYLVRRLVHLGILESVLVTEYAYVINDFGNTDTNVSEFMLAIVFAVYGHLSAMKVYFIYQNQKNISHLLIDLRQIYPHGAQEQADYNLERYYKIYWWRCEPFVRTCLVLVVVHHLMPIVEYYTFNYWLGWWDIERKMPYYVWLPWSTEAWWWYFVLYFMVCSAGTTTMISAMGCDSLLYGTVSQIIMHYDYLSKRIESYVATGEAEDIDFFGYVIRYHQRLLKLSNQLNDIFHNILLLNFMVSSINICCSSFMIQLNESETNLVAAIFVFVLCSLIQVYTISRFAEELHDASTGVGHAVFNQNWFNGDLRYKKMLSLCIQRAQQPAMLKTTFFIISLKTFTELMQMSYKFLALLRTMYAE